MAEHAIAIPEPMPEDPETVVTALETAAIFGARGDASEAMRWVRHAATSAGESGCDSRALDLARAASDLTPAPQEVVERRRSLPVPPSRPVSLRPELAISDEPRARPTRPPPPSASRLQSAVAAVASLSRPAAVSSAAPSAGSGTPTNVASRPAQSARPWPAASHRPSAAPRPVATIGSVRPSASIRPSPARDLGRPSPARDLDSPPPARDLDPPSAPDLDPPSAPDDLDDAVPTPRSAPSPSAVSSEASVDAGSRVALFPGARSAARVCLTPGSEPGVFVARVLADGAPVPDESLEAYLIVADPEAKLFSGTE
jgi:hypothetical protein